MMHTHEAVQPLLADLALGSLSDSDRQQVVAHLSTCAACAMEARELAEAFQGIGLENEPLAPPVHLRARVLTSLGREPRAPSAAGHVLKFGPPPARTWTRSPALLALAATLVLVLGGLLTLTLRQTQHLEEALRGAQDESSRLAARIAETGAQADLAVAILTAADMHRIDLAGVDSSRDATARGYWSASRGLLIVADRLPSPPPGKVYQVWLIGSSSAGPVSAGLIESGRGMLIVPAPRGVTGDTVTIAVTDEPSGGRPAPTGSKHLLGSL